MKPTMPTLPLSLADAFALGPFTGNPAAVCIVENEWPADSAMSKFAAEMNQSETAFLLLEKNRWQLRWFAPYVEVDLCGHATLAAAHALWQWQKAASDCIEFETRSGVLTASRNGSSISLDFPVTRATEIGGDVPSRLATALGVESKLVVFVGRTTFDFLVVLESEAAIRELNPNFHLLNQEDVRGLIATAKSTCTDYDIVSRFFAPQCGINEDPVTGSAHCCLADYWSAILNRQQLVAFQASERCGRIELDVSGPRVRLTGTACTVFETEIQRELLYS